MVFVMCVSHTDRVPPWACSLACRYFDNLGEAGDFFSGGKGTASPSQHHHQQQHSVDRYSNPPNPHTSSTSSKDIRTSVNKAMSSTAPRLTPQEIMKRRMQAQLNKTMNAEKKAELERLEKQERERMDREEGLRKLAAQMRQREIEKRLAERGFRHQLSSHHSSTGAASSSRRSASSSTTSRSCSPTSPIVPPALRRTSPSQPSTKSVLEGRRERDCVVRLHRFVVETTKIDTAGVRADSRRPVALTPATMVNEEILLCARFLLYVCA
ncbi:CLK4-associating serine/arginine rich protein [Taenia solium]|eukprot:TsM_000578300 transcript=TsM_000578300 gene=TsM_000578300